MRRMASRSGDTGEPGRNRAAVLRDDSNETLALIIAVAALHAAAVATTTQTRQDRAA